MESGTFRLRDIKRMEDRYELSHGSEILEQTIRATFQFWGNNDDEKIKTFAYHLSNIHFFICKHFYITTSSQQYIRDQINNSKKFKDLNNKMKNKITFYIGSLSANPNNEYLWNNYAEKSKGIVIGFQYNSFINLHKINIKKVDYRTNEEKKEQIGNIIKKAIMEISLNNNPMLNDYLKIVKDTIIYAVIFKKAEGTKGEKYINEEEYRIVGLNIKKFEENFKRCKDDKGIEYINLPLKKIEFYKSIKKIIFGSNCNTYQKNKIRKICTDKGINCQFIEYNQIQNKNN